MQITLKQLLVIMCSLYLCACMQITDTITEKVAPRQSALTVAQGDIARGSTGKMTVATQHVPFVLDKDKVLTAVNEVRATGRLCGNKFYPAAPPLSWDDHLQQAAQGHAEDMARQDYFDHKDKRGYKSLKRAMEVGYPARVVGENIGAGYVSFKLAMAGWVASPGHCQNLMHAEFREMGLGYAYENKSNWGRYWVMTFGTKQSSHYRH